MKTYHIQYRVGRAKYLLSFHNGTSTHDDGSPFFDGRIFKSMKALLLFEQRLLNEGYVYKY